MMLWQISPGSIGERAGLKLDDMIIKINGEDVSKLGMRCAMQRLSIGWFKSWIMIFHKSLKHENCIDSLKAGDFTYSEACNEIEKGADSFEMVIERWDTLIISQGINSGIGVKLQALPSQTTINIEPYFITENEQHGEITEVFVSLVGPSLAALSTRSRGFSKYPLRLGNGRSVRLAWISV